MSFTTNPPTAMPAMSLFDELAELCIKVQPDDKDPHQWIFSVDDSWLHPVDSDVRIALNGESSEIVGCLPVFAASEQPPYYLPNEAPFTAIQKAGFTLNPDDKGVAEKLIAFVEEKAKKGHRYGVAFCSFEYFWKYIKDIDVPQNAVLFDIRHALGWDGSKIQRVGEDFDLGLLRDEWKRQITETEIFDQTLAGVSDSGAIMTRLGWYLHYAVKFASIPGQSGARCAVGFNHIQIVSSAVNPDPGSGRSDALSDYSEVQKAIWSRLPDDDERVAPDHFAFSPMPKDVAMQTGLGVFHNSFKNAADWGRIKMWFFEDLSMVYNHEQASRGHFNTTEAANQAPWKWRSWLPFDKRDVTHPLYKTYDEDPWIRINDLLRMLCHSGVREFPREWACYDNKQVLLPTTPGFVFVILLIDFVNNLAPKDGRMPPVVEYQLEESDGTARFHIKVTLANSGAKNLWFCYTNGKKPNEDSCGTASKALRALGAQRFTEASVYEIHEQKDVASHLKTTIFFNSDFPEIPEPSNDEIIITLSARNQP